jgi:predicted TIM-barrel fold metal-dependent hydrolase
MPSLPVIDADGHITESVQQLQPYMQRRYPGAPHLFDRRSYYSEDGWDRSLGGRLGSLAPDARTWLSFMDDGEIESAVLYPTGGLGIGWVREPEFAVALCQAYNDFVHEEFVRLSPRLRAVCLLPLQDVGEAVKELRRCVLEQDAVGVFLPAVGLRLPLGHRQFHPIYETAQELGVMLAVHATVRGPHYFGADGFDRFIEVHTLSHPFAQMMQLTGMVFGGVPEKFPRLRIGYMESGCSWVGYWMDRMDEEWEKRGEIEAPGCRRKPSEYIRGGQLYFHAEADEKSIPDAVRRLGDDVLFYATDFPHWDHGFPESKHELAERDDLSVETRRKILHDNAQQLYQRVPAAVPA